MRNINKNLASPPWMVTACVLSFEWSQGSALRYIGMLQCCAGQRLDIMLHMTCLVRRSAVENRLPVVHHLQLPFTFQRPHLSRGFVRVYIFFCRFNISYHIFDGTGFHSVIYHCWRHFKKMLKWQTRKRTYGNDKNDEECGEVWRPPIKTLLLVWIFLRNVVKCVGLMDRVCLSVRLTDSLHAITKKKNFKSTHSKFYISDNFILIRIVPQYRTLYSKTYACFGAVLKFYHPTLLPDKRMFRSFVA
jgi:hypothetical protein